VAGKGRFHLTDGTMKPFIAYSYTAEAVDDDSLHSGRSKPVDAMVKTIPDLPPLQSLTAEYDAKARQVHLRWTYTTTGNYFFILYKGSTRFRSLGPDKREYIDSDLPAGGGAVAYAIQVMFRDKRGQTRISERVPVILSPPK
jgi:hypothetical protein